MTNAPDFWLDHPPVWELGLTVQTATPGVVDNYDIRRTHDLFRTELPAFSRQEPVDIFALPGPIALTPDDPNYRWWLTDPSGPWLLQLQEDLTGLNWRRLDLPPAMPHPYPGFYKTLDRFRAQIDTLRQHRESEGNVFPDPLGGELLYDNFLLLVDADGEKLNINDLFRPVREPFNPAVRNFVMAWEEAIPGMEASGGVRVQATGHGIALPNSDPQSALRLNFSSRARFDTWDEGFNFFEVAHTHIRQRFLQLTTDKCHTIWGMK